MDPIPSTSASSTSKAIDYQPAKKKKYISTHQADCEKEEEEVGIQFQSPFGKKQLFVVCSPGLCFIGNIAYFPSQPLPKLQKGLRLYPEDIPVLLNSVFLAFQFMSEKEPKVFRERLTTKVNNTAIFTVAELTPKRVYIEMQNCYGPSDNSSCGGLKCTFDTILEVQEFGESLLATTFHSYGLSLPIVSQSILFIDILCGTESGQQILEDWPDLPMNDAAKKEVLIEICGSLHAAHYMNWQITTRLTLYKNYFLVKLKINQLNGI